MEGVVDPVTRSIYSEIGGYNHFVTEFVRVTDQLLPDHVFYKYSPELYNSGRTTEGHPVYVQLLGGKPEWLAVNAARVVQLGASGIDLNFGCPAKTVNRHDGGAALLQKPSRLFDIITSVRKAVEDKVPVTAKVRLGFMDKSLSNEIALAVAEAGAASLTVHARTKLEGYQPPAHWEYIAQMKEQVAGRVPVVANGDIWSLADYIRCCEVSGCKDVALGRGAIAKPDLALEIQAYQMATQVEALPWSQIQTDWLNKFIDRSEQAKGPRFAITRTKQWLKLMGRQYDEAVGQFENIKRLQDLDELRAQIRS